MGEHSRMGSLLASTPLRMLLAALAAVPLSFAVFLAGAELFLPGLASSWTIEQSGDTRSVGVELFDRVHVEGHSPATQAESARLSYAVEEVFGRYCYIDISEGGGENAGETLLTLSVHHKVDDPKRFGPDITLQEVARQPEDNARPVVSRRLGFASEDRTVNVATGADGCGLDIGPIEPDALSESRP